MFDVTAGEFLLIVAVALVVVGPKRLVETTRRLGRSVGRVRAELGRFKQGIEQEMKVVTAPVGDFEAELRQVGADLKEITRGVQDGVAESLGEVRDSLEQLQGLFPARPRWSIRRRRP